MDGDHFLSFWAPHLLQKLSFLWGSGPFGQHFPVNAKAHAVDFDCGPLRVDLEVGSDLYVYIYICIHE